MKACSNATKTSNAVKANKKMKGAMNAAVNRLPSIITNVANSLRIMCPATMLAAKRIASVQGRARNEIISSGTISGAMYSGVPCGKNRLKNLNPCKYRPVPITVRDTMSDRMAVEPICEVAV